MSKSPSLSVKPLSMEVGPMDHISVAPDPLEFSSSSSSDSESVSCSLSSTESDAAMWGGFLLERFPEYGSKEFLRLRESEWRKYGLDSEYDFYHNPEAPAWFKVLKKRAVKQKLVLDIEEEFSRRLKERKDQSKINMPHVDAEKLDSLLELVNGTTTTEPGPVSPSTANQSVSNPTHSKEGSSLVIELKDITYISARKLLKPSDMKELCRYVWEKNHLLFKESNFPKLWADVLGNKDDSVGYYMAGIVDGDRLTGIWGLILNEAWRYEKSFEGTGESWQSIRRYQNLDGSEIRPMMTVYREMRDELDQTDSELSNVFFGSLPSEAFPVLDPKLGFWGSQNAKGKFRKRPLTINYNVLMISDIETVDQRFSCMFSIDYAWKQSMNGARNYYIKQQLDELDEESTDKEKVFKAEWKPPEPTLQNAIAMEMVKMANPLVLDEQYNTLQSSVTYRATFSEKLELENFPFDCQKFQISMDFKGNDFLLKGKNENFITVNWKMFALDEWKLPTHAIDCTIQRVQGVTHSNNVHIAFNLQRDASSYVYKLAITSFMIVSGSFMFFGITNDELADRLIYIATMFLTGQAFQVVATTETPSLGYLTMIDYFLVIGNCFIYLQFFFAVLIRFYCNTDEPTDSVNLVCLAISTTIYLCFSLSWTLWARLISIPAEMAKQNATQLDLDSLGFVYILTYTETDDPTDNSKVSGFNEGTEINEMKNELLELEVNLSQVSDDISKLQADNLRTKLKKKKTAQSKRKILQIVGKHTDDRGANFKLLSGKHLEAAIKAKEESVELDRKNWVQYPTWKKKNMDRILEKKLKKRKSGHHGHHERKSRHPESPSESKHLDEAEVTVAGPGLKYIQLRDESGGMSRI